MPSIPEQEALNKGMIVMWIMWAAIFTTLFIYVLVCHFVGDQIRQNVNPGIPLALLRNILFIVSIVTLIFSYFLRRTLLTVRPSNIIPPTSSISQSSIQPAFLGKYTTTMIITLALSESVGIYGVVLYFLGDSLQTLYTFIGASAVAMIFYRPNREELITLSNDMKMS